MLSRLWWMTCWAKWLPRTIPWKIESSHRMDQKSVYPKIFIFPQQRKLMGSSAQNSSGVHWCRCRVRFNEVPEKVPKVPEKVWDPLVQSQVRFSRVPEKVRSGRPWCRARSGPTGRLWRRARSGSTGFASI